MPVYKNVKEHIPPNVRENVRPDDWDTGGAAPAPSGGALLLEDGASFLLMEDGVSKLLLE